ncbi:MAG: asparagine synthetase B [Crocinitomicaceae bacterium]|nr:asparagine synthetase B [Flavobacteriales bacterium]NQZ37741.1 asparagine synthetase B [Crocinitomicaceae bacterium]
MKGILILFTLLSFAFNSKASQILIPMDETQTNHLKAYGLAFYLLENEIVIDWLLNYRGGSFMVPHSTGIEEELLLRGVSYEIIANGQASAIKNKIADPEVNMETVQLEKVPKIAVYTPGGKMPWDDAVTLVLEYAGIPYDKIYDSAVVMGMLPEYDWLHLHHEDFTGQYGKFYARYRNYPWYRDQVTSLEASAAALGFNKVSEMKLSVATSIKNFVIGGGFLFTMCSGTDSFDISLAAHKTDICESMFDGDAAHRNCQGELDFANTFAFKDFTLERDPLVYEYSNIDGTKMRNAFVSEQVAAKTDKFSLFDFSAKWDVVPTMLTQCHTDVVNGFMGQTTDFKKEFIKPNVLILGETKQYGTARYIHGEMGQGTWTFYGGHDPEDYRHIVGDPPTDLDLHPNSPGYRLILNNILFPAAKKKKRQT